MSTRIQQQQQQGGRPGSAISQSEMDDGQAEVELQKLQRQYRAMEAERKAYSEEAKVQLGKQRLSIEKLRRECQQLQDELRVLDHKLDDSRSAEEQRAKADALLAQLAVYQRNIKAAQQELANAESELNALFKQQQQQQAAIAAQGGSEQKALSTPQAVDKHMRTLENRLDKALVRFNKGINNNREMRTQIDMLRRERAVFDGVYRKFERELADHKRQMAEIVEFSNACYEARDEAQAKMGFVKERAEKELQSHLGEMKELDRILEQDRRLKDFMSTKTGDREAVDLSLQQKKQQRQRAQLGANNANSNNARNSLEGLTDTLDQYEQLLAQLLQVTGADDINAVVSKFNEFEDQNFSLFNYVNEVNADIERAQEDVEGIQRQIDALKTKSDSSSEERQQRLKRLEEQLATTESQANAYEERRANVGTVLEIAGPQITALFKKLLPNAPLPTNSILGASMASESSSSGAAAPAAATAAAPSLAGVSDLLVVLSGIESETADLLVRNLSTALPQSSESPAGEESEQQQQRRKMMLAGSLLGQGPMAPVTLNVVVPGAGDDLDDDGLSEDEDRVLTREELIQKTLRGLSKREKSGQATQKAKTARRRSPTRS